MTLEQQFVAVIQLGFAGLLGAVIGIERERRQHEAGLRTHMLVALGACLFTVLSIYAFPGSDPGRVASQILPGMGFLGAGSIIKYGRDIQGLTTAASMWFTAAVGMSIGTGAWFLALCGTLIVWFVLSIMHRFARKVSHPVGKQPKEKQRKSDKSEPEQSESQ